jgi:hypothetical protein
VLNRGTYIDNEVHEVFIVRRDAIVPFYDLAVEFWHYARSLGYQLPDEPILAYDAPGFKPAGD